MRWAAVLAPLLVLAGGEPAAAQVPPETLKACFGPKPNASIAACTTIIDARLSSPKDVSLALRGRADAYQVKRQFERALNDYTEALRLDSLHLDVYVGRSRLYSTIGQHDRALEDCETALRLRPGYTRAIYCRSRANFYNAEFGRCLQDIDMLVKIEPSATNYAARCAVRGAINEIDGAIADCTEALRLQPNFIYAFVGRGSAYLKLGQPEKALADYEASLRVHPDNWLGLFGRGVARIKMGDGAGGAADMAKAKRLNPDAERHFKHVWRLDL